MSTKEHHSTDTKPANKPPKGPNPADPVAGPALEPFGQAADPGSLQRALAHQKSGGRRNPVPRIQRTYGNRVANRMIARKIQGTPAKDGQKKKVNRRPENGPTGEQMINRVSDDPAGGMDVSSNFESAVQKKQGGGEPLPDSTRGSMERSFESDFSNVRVHHDSESDSLNRSVGARAFTVGQDVFFAKDEYNPGSKESNKLIAHELTHTIQQTGQKPVSQAKMKVAEVDDPYEQEADTVADEVVNEQSGQSQSSQLQTKKEGAIQREEDEKTQEEKEAEEKKEAESQAAEAKEENKQATPDAKEEKDQGDTGGGGEGGGGAKAEEGDEEISTEFDDPSVYDDEPLGELEEPDLEEYEPNPEDYDDFRWDPTKEASLPGWDDEVAYADSFDAIESGDWSGIKSTEDGSVVYDLGINELALGKPSALAELDRDKMIGDAFAQGALAGLVDGAISLAVGTAIGLAATKIPFMAGAVAIFQIAYDPEAWFKSTFIEGIANPAKDIFKGPGDEDTGWGIAAWFIERIIAVIKLAAGILNLITTIMAIVSALLYIIGNILTAFVFTAPAGAAMIAAAGTLNGWMAVLGVVGLYLQIAQIVASMLAMAFRALDLKFSQADPEKLMAKQAKLQGHVKDFVSNSVQVGGNLAIEAGKAKLEGKSPKDAVKSQFDIKAKIADVPDFSGYDKNAENGYFKAPDTDADVDVKAPTDVDVKAPDTDLDVKTDVDEDGMFDIGGKSIFDEGPDVKTEAEEDGLLDIGGKNIFDEGPEVKTEGPETQTETKTTTDEEDEGGLFDIGGKDLFDQPESEWVKGRDQLKTDVTKGALGQGGDISGQISKDIAEGKKGGYGTGEGGSSSLGDKAGAAATGFAIEGDPDKLREEAKTDAKKKEKLEKYESDWKERYGAVNWEEKIDEFLQERAGDLPEKPETEAQIAANYFALVMLADEKRRLAAQMDMADQVVAQGEQQQAAGDSLKQVTGANKEALGKHQGDLGDKASKLEVASASADEASPMAAENESKSKDASGGLQANEGLMEGGLKKAQEEEQDTGGADPGDTKEGGKESEQGAKEMTKVVEAGQKLAAEWQEKTASAQQESEEFVGDMDEIDDHISSQQDLAQEGTEEGLAAKEEAESSMEELNANEDELMGERESIIGEGQEWMEEHASVRAEIFAELQELLGGEDVGEISEEPAEETA